jgi:cobalt-zinc-cadmium efflux system membrane fusion protein
MNETSNHVSTLESGPARGRPNAPGASNLSSTRPDPNNRGSLGWLLESAPTLLVLGLICGLAYWGHHTGWTVPKFSELFSNGTAAKDDWCAEHSVPESACVECNESLLPRSKPGWCRKHGVHDCPLEHPEIVQAKEPVEVAKADLERAQRALDLKERKGNNSKCKLNHRRLQFASTEVLAKMGVDITPVARDEIVETVSVSGEIVYEQPRVAPLFSSAAGRVWALTDKAKVGASVKTGDVIALIDAADIGKAKTELLQAITQLDLKRKGVEALQPLVPQGAVPQTRLLEAEAALREAQVRQVAAQQTLVNLGLPVRMEDVQRLSPEQLGRMIQFLGIPQQLVSHLDPSTTTANLLAVRASRDGVVVESRVVAGEMTDVAKTLFVIADLSQMWLKLNVRSEDVKYLRVRDDKSGTPGQKVRFRPDGSDEEVVGELVWKSTAADERTRTLQFRADVPNREGKLTANTFGNGKIILRQEKDAIVVPTEAVHWEGDCHIVFVRDKNFLDEGAPKVFHVRTVMPGVANGLNTEIIAGLWPGEVVATKNSAALRAELLKNNLGAG